MEGEEKDQIKMKKRENPLPYNSSKDADKTQNKTAKERSPSKDNVKNAKQGKADRKSKFSKKIRKKKEGLRRKDDEGQDEKEDPFPGDAPIDEEKIKKYARGQQVDKSELHGLARHDYIKKTTKYKYAAKQAARTELLLTEQAGYLEADEGEHTSEFRQSEIAEEVDISSAQKYFELDLNQFGPYRLNYTRNGRHLLLGGGRGHIAALDWQTKKLMCELNVMETCHDVKWLHVEMMFAVAQKQWVYIYDNQGLELHCLKSFNNVLRMEFLPYHFLLVGANDKGSLRWVDTSIGKDVVGYNTHLGRLDVMCQNPTNAIIHLGHTKGTVSLWSPNIQRPLVKMLCHKGGGVRSVCVDPTGNYMATSGIDRKLKIWDLRQYRELNSCKIGYGASSLSFSQNGLLAAGLNDIVEVYKDPRQTPITEPYLRHHCRSSVNSLQFVPYEDVLGASCSKGFTSLLVPGAGEANYDALEANPYRTKKQRQEAEVKMLLDKIQPDLITLETDVLSRVNQKAAEDEYEKQVHAHLIAPRRIEFKTPRHRMKGAGKSGRFEARKREMKEKARKTGIKEKQGNKLAQELDRRRKHRQKQLEENRLKSAGVLGRFMNKPR